MSRLTGSESTTWHEVVTASGFSTAGYVLSAVLSFGAIAYIVFLTGRYLYGLVL